MSDQDTKTPVNKGTQTESAERPAERTDPQEHSFLKECFKLDSLYCNSTASPSAEDASSGDLDANLQHFRLNENKVISFSSLSEGSSDIPQDLIFEEAESDDRWSPSSKLDPNILGNNTNFEKDIDTDALLANTKAILEGLAAKPNRKKATLLLLSAVSKLQEQIDQATKHCTGTGTGTGPSSRTS